MAIRVSLSHKTRYEYDRLVALSAHTIRLRPAPYTKTPIVSYSLKVSPKDHFLNWQLDPFGNYQAQVVFQEKTDHLEIEVELVADLHPLNPFDFFPEEYARRVPFSYTESLERSLQPYLKTEEQGPAFHDFFKQIEKENESSIDFLVYLNSLVRDKVGYIVRMEPGIQSCETTLQNGSGSCRDSAFLLMNIFRSLGIASRFCSGYLIQLRGDDELHRPSDGPTSDFTDLHAWTEVYLPGAGWIGLDPTSGLFAGEGHIPLAATADATDASPVLGYSEPCNTEFYFEMSVKRLYEDPRPTHPYEEKHWKEIQSIGKKIFQDISDSDMRLTIGGEPTFVSDSDRDSRQWHFDALGDEKLEKARELISKMKNEFSNGGILQETQGKWYPGEPLPRWSLNCIFRRDSIPLQKLQSEPRSLDFRKAAAFRKHLSTLLGLDSEHWISAFEDSEYYHWLQSRVSEREIEEEGSFEALERNKLNQMKKKGMENEAGYVLPLLFDSDRKKWESSFWKIPDNGLRLVPGDSPVGLRLPLSSLPNLKRQPETSIPSDDGLPSWEEFAELQDKRKIERYSLSESGIRSCLCVELRDEILRVFMPPVAAMEEWVDLYVAIERAAYSLDLSFSLEGYEPPSDPRVTVFRITPDPGVIEVNLHPSSTWEELEKKSEILYKNAYQSGLTAEKFMMDGRPCATGGGNHITMGASEMKDSPFLRRPHLLRSWLNYTQNHPALSYFFSGQYIGATSQSPRLDESRPEAIFELEIAFRRLEQYPDEDTPFWLVDRLFRNLLVDGSGNTHRAEISIDKLYAPGSANGRLGLVEFRAFEMPPHYRMFIVQQLFVLSLTARFWNHPYREPLVRWHTDLTDRFTLPFFLWKDLEGITEDLNRFGFEWKSEHFLAFYYFRFPLIGSIQIDSIQLELRMALEPWPVLGEETSPFGTSRPVDSAVERIQVFVKGITEGRHFVTCNGYKIPLHPTGNRGEYVCGIRYKAWSPVFTLHPDIEVHTPLILTVWDDWNEKALGGCTYHVSHPGGRSYETFPVNSLEAESRRHSRFWDYGQSQEIKEVPNSIISQDYPYTFDLRMIP